MDEDIEDPKESTVLLDIEHIGNGIDSHSTDESVGSLRRPIGVVVTFAVISAALGFLASSANAGSHAKMAKDAKGFTEFSNFSGPINITGGTNHIGDDITNNYVAWGFDDCKEGLWFNMYKHAKAIGPRTFVSTDLNQYWAIPTKTIKYQLRHEKNGTTSRVPVWHTTWLKKRYYKRFQASSRRECFELCRKDVACQAVNWGSFKYDCNTFSSELPDGTIDLTWMQHKINLSKRDFPTNQCIFFQFAQADRIDMVGATSKIFLEDLGPACRQNKNFVFASNHTYGNSTAYHCSGIVMQPAFREMQYYLHLNVLVNMKEDGFQVVSFSKGQHGEIDKYFAY